MGMDTTGRERLHPSRLNALAVRGPRYRREALRGGIVHLGIGAFHRAHQAVVTEDALEADAEDRRWGIVGVSLRRPDTRDALMPQGGLYTLAVRDGAGESLRVVGAVIDVLVAAEAPDAVIDRIAHPDTRIVSLTITEKGYCHDPGTGALNPHDPDIAHDLRHEVAPVTALGYLARGLQRRRERGLGPVTLLSCDNLASNGDTLRGVLLAFTERYDPALRAWIDAHCAFPNSMVDRIVPKTTEEDVARVSSALGLHDAWPVAGEPFLQWVVEDRFAAGRPHWEAGGAQFVDDAQPFERLKHRLVNGSQSMMAYFGVMAGWSTTDRVIAQPPVRTFIHEAMRHELQPTLPPLPGLDVDAYRDSLLPRFENPALGHRTRQIAMDGSQKIPQRLLAPIAERLARGEPFDRLALGVAAWIHFLRGYDERSEAYPIEDPMAAALRPLAGDVARITGYVPVFGDLGTSAIFVETVGRQLARLRQLGTLAAVTAP
ncbi:mannitol dehydrogenase family protein [Cupriavidus plantarum]|uniref:mannitol dehydrogenase family protein n=1 Tax=Cupriavidus plantarum TaxID=942865 RepID=UPI0038B2CE99